MVTRGSSVWAFSWTLAGLLHHSKVVPGWDEQGLPLRTQAANVPENP